MSRYSKHTAPSDGGSTAGKLVRMDKRWEQLRRPLAPLMAHCRCGLYGWMLVSISATYGIELLCPDCRDWKLGELISMTPMDHAAWSGGRKDKSL